MSVRRETGGGGVAAVSLLLGLGLAGTVGPAAAVSGAVGVIEAMPPLQQDAAEELYREARGHLSRGRPDLAAETFQRLAEAYPESDRAADALYWAAYALYSTEEYQAALAALERQAERYPEAARDSEARTLRVRIEGELARRGDADAAVAVAEVAREAAVVQSRLAQRQAEIARRQARVANRMAERQAEAAERRGEAAARRVERAAVPDVQEVCEEDEVQSAALNALLMMDPERALPVLEKVMARRDPCSEPLRRQATFLIGQKGGERAEELLLDVVRNDPSLEVRSQAVFWLSQVEGERAVGILQEILGTSEEPELQDKAVFAISQHRSDRAFQILRDYVMDESRPAKIRAQAIFWLGQHRAFQDIGVLTDLYGRLDSRELKEQVFFAISQNADQPGALDWLVERALDPGEELELRKQALFWAGQGGVALERLDGLYDSVADREIKEQLVFIYSQRRGPEAVERLIRIARTEEDRELRKNAIFWLGQSNDPRAAEFLVELLETPDR